MPQEENDGTQKRLYTLWWEINADCSDEEEGVRNTSPEDYIYVEGNLTTLERADIKTITLNKKEVLYAKSYGYHPDDMSDHTTFYEITGKLPVKTWSWRKFRYIETGELADNYVRLFKINLWIEDHKYTKGYIRGKLEKEFELLGRKKEIENGIII